MSQETNDRERLARIIERQNALIDTLRSENERLLSMLNKYEKELPMNFFTNQNQSNLSTISGIPPVSQTEKNVVSSLSEALPSNPLETFRFPPPPKELPDTKSVTNSTQKLASKSIATPPRIETNFAPHLPTRVASSDALMPKDKTQAQDLHKKASQPIMAISELKSTQPRVQIVTPTREKDSVDSRAAFLYSILDKLKIHVPNSLVLLNNDNKEYTVYEIVLLEVTGKNSAPTEIWRLQKRYSDFLQLHSYLKQSLTEKQLAAIGSIPKASFKDQDRAPSKTDGRRIALQSYIQAVVSTGPSKAILRFLSTDQVSGRQTNYIFNSIIEGYLVKKGRRLLGWKRRYFVLINEYLHYWESKEDALQSAKKCRNNQWHIDFCPAGSLHLKFAKISKQKQNTVNEYRHALMIRENGDKRSILCAESDSERDEWVLALVNQIEKVRDRYEEEPLLREDKEVQESTLITAPTPVTYASNEKNQSSTEENEKRNSHVFGASLQDAADFAKIKEGYELPAIVFRCIEYLEERKAFLEEGIYRQNGDARLIEYLSDCFEKDGDVELIKIPSLTDVNAVTGLLKKYLRDLPEPILTSELQKAFLNVMDLLERSDKIIELARLVSLLPLPNYTLLRALISHFLHIVRYSDVNKMNARNMAIILSPTLGIPAGIFTLMMAEFEFIFWVDTGKGSSQPPSPLPKGDQVSVDNSHQQSQQDRLKAFEEEKSASEKAKKRRTWRADQFEVKGRSNTNSQVYQMNAPEPVRFYETWITADQLAADEEQKLNALQDELEQLEDCEDDLYETGLGQAQSADRTSAISDDPFFLNVKSLQPPKPLVDIGSLPQSPIAPPNPVAKEPTSATSLFEIKELESILDMENERLMKELQSESGSAPVTPATVSKKQRPVSNVRISTVLNLYDQQSPYSRQSILTNSRPNSVMLDSPIQYRVDDDEEVVAYDIDYSDESINGSPMA